MYGICDDESKRRSHIKNQLNVKVKLINTIFHCLVIRSLYHNNSSNNVSDLTFKDMLNGSSNCDWFLTGLSVTLLVNAQTKLFNSLSDKHL